MERRILSGRAMALVLALGALLPLQAVVAQEIRTEQVRFGPGQSGATITGAITANGAMVISRYSATRLLDSPVAAAKKME